MLFYFVLITNQINTCPSYFLSEFEYPDLEFKFLMFDVEEETKKANLYKLQIDSGIRTVNEIRKEEGLEEVEWGDDDPKRNQGNNFNIGNPLLQEQERKKKESVVESRTEGKKEKVEKEKKNIETKPYQDNPLILRENETMGEDRLEKSIVYLLRQNEKKIKDLIEKEIGKNKLQEIKSIDGIAKAIKTILNFGGLKIVSDTIIKNTFVKGWDSAEKQLDKNLMFNNEVVQYIQDYTFNNIKGMTEEITQDVRQELERGIMAGEGVAKIKARITKVFDKGENRAEMIARTETNRAEGYGKLQAFKSSGDRYQKKWVAKIDKRTSAICKRLDGQVVGMDDNFKDKTTGWEGPTHPAHVDCRSSLIFIKKE